MKSQSININPRAYAALLASASRTVLAQDAQPIRAAEFEPLLRNGFRRNEIKRALAKRLRGNLASDAADPEAVSAKLLDMLDGGAKPEKEPEMNTSDRSPRRGARDGLDADLQKTLRMKLNPQEFDALMAAIGGGSNADEPRGESEYSEQQFGAAPRQDEFEDASDRSAMAKPGDFKNDDEPAEDDPPPFGGKPLPGGKLMPLDTKQPRKPVPDGRSQAMDESFAKRFPMAARFVGEPQRQYRDGVPTHDPRLLGGSTPTPRRAPAMDSASSVRASESFAERFPGAARVKVM